jgi:alpha-L-fucosidase
VRGVRPRLRDLRRHPVPTWWRDAKLGIFVHWTPASVAGWAPVDADINELVLGHDRPLVHTPYTEWYQNSLHFPDSPVSAHHRETYGDRPYDAFADDFRAGLTSWDPDAWARSFEAAGARYVVLVTKHHDGFCLWPSAVDNPNRAGWHTGRDVVGELADAVRARGLRFGVYYSGGLDWTFDDRPLATLADGMGAVPRGRYPAYAEAQVRELVERYRPDVLWNDIAWPTDGRRLWQLFADYYDAVPEGVVNDRWAPWSPVLPLLATRRVKPYVEASARRQLRRDGGLVPPRVGHGDYRTPEYVVFPDVRSTPWECVRGMDRSFGYNRNSRPEHFLGTDELVTSLTDIASKNGNLLLNVGPRGEDASIPAEQLERLAALGRWMDRYGAAVRGTRPWVRPATRTHEGHDVRFTARDRDVFALVWADAPTPTWTLPAVEATPSTSVRLLGGPEVPWRRTGDGLEITVPADLPPAPARAVALRDVRAR